MPWRESLYVFAISWLLAQVEIQIEGAHGWAERLPTWRWDDPRLLAVTNGKPVTGYHVYLTLFLIGLLHFPLLFTGWSRAVEARVLGSYFLLTCVWDFQWFVWNPAWGPARFFRERVWWFPRRLLGFPIEYYASVAASAASVWWLDPAGLHAWLRVVAGCLVLSAAAAALALASSSAPRATS